MSDEEAVIQGGGGGGCYKYNYIVIDSRPARWQCALVAVASRREAVFWCKELNMSPFHIWQI